MSRRGRLLRDVEGFEAACVEVIKRCEPGRFRGALKQAGGWIPPESIRFATPALVYNIAVGVGRNRWLIGLEEKYAEEPRSNVVHLNPQERPRTIERVRADIEAAGGPYWLPAHLDGIRYSDGAHYGYEPTIAEFRAGLWGMGEGTP
jgi:hypothetical protein